MTDNNRNASNQGLRYTSPRVKVVEVKARSILCQSLGVNEWNPGSDSKEDMEEE